MDSTAKTSQQKAAAGFAQEEQTMVEMQECIEALVNYAAILSKQNVKEYLADLGDLIHSMLWVWTPEDFIDPRSKSTKLQGEYTRKIMTAARCSKVTVSSSKLSDKQLSAIIHGLSIHAENAAAERDNLLEVWQCCRLARKLREDYSGRTSQALTLRGDFTIDESDRFTKFGSIDPEHLIQGAIRNCPVLVFNAPVPADQLPEGWCCRHLTGRNIRHVDGIQKSLPESGYVGSVLSPCEIIWGRRETQRIASQFSMSSEFICLDEFCKKIGVQTSSLDGLFPDWEESPAQMLGGMTLG